MLCHKAPVRAVAVDQSGKWVVLPPPPTHTLHTCYAWTNSLCVVCVCVCLCCVCLCVVCVVCVCVCMCFLCVCVFFLCVYVFCVCVCVFACACVCVCECYWVVYIIIMLGCSSVGRASDGHAADTGLMFWCGKGFFSQSQLSVQTLTVLVHPHMQSHAWASVCMLKIL